MYMCIYICVYVYIFEMYICIYVYVYMYICIYVYEYVGLQGPLYILKQYTFQKCIALICKAPGTPLHFKAIHFSKMYCFDM